MIKAEFGIIDAFNEKDDYTLYSPDKYHCIAIDDDIYMNDWWESLCLMDTFNVYEKGVLQPQRSLSRHGITIIPPHSLHVLLKTVTSDERYKKDECLMALSELIQKAINQNKHMIHYGI